MIFYHNITKQLFNITDIDDLLAESKSGDLIMFSESGNALIQPLDGQKRYILNNYKQNHYPEA